MSRLADWRKRLEGRLREIFRPSGPPQLIEAMSYYLFQEGKRIRPLLLIALTDALGGEIEDAITVGCVIEMIHNYSLIHDDLPAMDNDDFRRGLPSCHRKFGEAMAILAGDALLTYAFEVLGDLSNFKGLSERALLNIIKTVAFYAGNAGMVGGQVLDIQGGVSSEEISDLKTAALFRAVFICAGIIAGVGEERIADLGKAGRFLGLLFQVTDDIIDRDGYFTEIGEKASHKLVKELRKNVERSILIGAGTITPELRELIDLIYKRIT